MKSNFKIFILISLCIHVILIALIFVFSFSIKKINPIGPISENSIQVHFVNSIGTDQDKENILKRVKTDFKYEELKKLGEGINNDNLFNNKNTASFVNKSIEYLESDITNFQEYNRKLQLLQEMYKDMDGKTVSKIKHEVNRENGNSYTMLSFMALNPILTKKYLSAKERIKRKNSNAMITYFIIKTNLLFQYDMDSIQERDDRELIEKYEDYLSNRNKQLNIFVISLDQLEIFHQISK
jgi:hypothetical protein